MSGEARKKAEKNAFAFYVCPKKECHLFNKEFSGPLPSVAAKSWKGSVRCDGCGTLCVARRFVSGEE